MPENNKQEPNQNSDEKLAEYEAKIAELEEKQSNLNQGIAKYRDEAQIANQRAEELETKIAELEARFESASPKERVKIDEEDEALLEAWAREKGFVSKEDLERLKSEQLINTQKQIENQAVAEFLKQHPQYDNDENWAKVQKEFQESFKPQSTVQGYLKVLEKIDKILSLPDAEKRGGDKVRAQMSTKGRLSLGGGVQRTPERENTIEDLQKRYPNLTKEQIAARLAEIDALDKG